MRSALPAWRSVSPRSGGPCRPWTLMRRRAQPWEARPPRAAPHAVRDTTTFGSHRQTRP